MYKIVTSCGKDFSSEDSFEEAQKEYVEHHICFELMEALKINKIIYDGKEVDEEELDDDIQELNYLLKKAWDKEETNIYLEKEFGLNKQELYLYEEHEILPNRCRRNF